MKKRVLFVNDEMVMGGVARILTTMLGKIDPDLFDVDVLILHAHGELLGELPTWVRVLHGTPFFDAVDINLHEAAHQHDWLSVTKKAVLLARMKWGFIENRIRQERAKMGLDSNPYDIEIAAKEGFCTVFVANGKSKRKLNWIHVDYSAQNYSIHHMRLLKSALKRIDQNIAVSQKAAAAYQALFETPPVITINNPIDIDSLRLKAKEACPFTANLNQVNLISVARFHPQKAVDRLVTCMAQIAPMHPQVHLYLIGSGPLEDDLKAQVQKLNLESNIHFLGQIKNPMPYIAAADLFVLSSLYEGYPTTVIEALIAQTPVLSTDVSGVVEQLIEDQTGWIVENSTDALCRKLSVLVDDVQKLRNLKSQLANYRYDNAHIIQRFQAALLGERL